MTVVESPGARRHRAPVLLFLAPTLIAVGLFVVVPLGILIIISTLRWDIINPPISVGGANWVNALTTPDVWESLGRTILLAFITVVPVSFLGLMLAKLIRASGSWALGLWPLALMPWLFAPIAVGIVWRWVFSPEDGLVATVLARRVDWITQPHTALIVIAIALVWNQVGYVALIWNIGLGSIPQEYRDQATVDGASPAGLLRFIEIPLLRNHSLFILVTTTLTVTAAFDQILVLTGGGPNQATRVISLAIYESAFVAFDMGHAATIAVMLLILQGSALAILANARRLKGESRDAF